MVNNFLAKVYGLLSEGKYDEACKILVELNEDYRNGNPKITDKEWDKLYDDVKALIPNHTFFASAVINIDIDSERKEKLKYPMYSLDSVKSVTELQKKIKSKGLPVDVQVIILSKYDGCSSLNKEDGDECWSRGDGINGQRLSEHYKAIGSGKKLNKNIYTIGELIINRKLFASDQHKLIKKDGEPYKNPRNMVAGLINEDTVNPYWSYVSHIRYGIANADQDFSMDKLEQLKQLPEIPYVVINADEITEELLDDLYYKWSEEWEIDGLVIDVNDKDLRKSLGREKNNNPAYAWSYKKEWVDPVKTELIDIEWNISKNGFLKPVALINPTPIGGVTVSRATGNNARFIVNNYIGKGAILNIVRGGSVIPKIISAAQKGVVMLPTDCPSCNCELVWNDNEVELMCINPDCKEIKFKKLSFFFTSFGIDGFGEGIAQLFFDNGYDTVAKVMNMKLSDIQVISGLGTLSGNKFLKEVEDKIRTTTFERLGHASGCFENLGSKKLKMILDGLGMSYDVLNKRYNIGGYTTLNTLRDKLLAIKGVSDKSADSFLQGLLLFTEFIKDLNINIVDKIIKTEDLTLNTTNIMKTVDLTGRAFLFTGIRDKNLEDYITSNGGELKSSYSKKVTDLIVKDDSFVSNKTKEAHNDGCRVIAIEDFRKSLM